MKAILTSNLIRVIALATTVAVLAAFALPAPGRWGT